MTLEVPWHKGTPEIRAEMACNGETHSVVWRDGDLFLENHDMEAERALVALGSEPCPCLSAWDGWAMRHEMKELLASSTGPGLVYIVEANLTYLVRILGQLTSARAASPNPGTQSVQSSLQNDLARNKALKALASLGPEIVSMATGDFIEQRISMLQEGNLAEFPRLDLESFLSERVLVMLDASMRSWRKLEAGTVLSTECWMGSPGEPPVVFGWMSHHGGLAGLTVGPEWILDVYLAGIALVDDCLVIERTRTGADRDWHDVLAVRWEPQWNSASVSSHGIPVERVDRHFADRWTPKVAPALVFRSGAEWHLSWTEEAGKEI